VIYDLELIDKVYIMNVYSLEYVWLDAKGTPRSKTKMVRGQPSEHLSVSDVPMWSFDGSSTGQAEGCDSDVFLKPVRVYENPFYVDIYGWFVLCECVNRDGSPHVSNTRALCMSAEERFTEHEPWFGIEQEYMVFERDGRVPYGWMTDQNPGLGHTTDYYCGVGGDRAFGRYISEGHAITCVQAGINLCGTNFEVTASQLEYQVGPSPPTKLADDLIMSRYILLRSTEDYDCSVSFEPKPYTQRVGGGEEWNGSGGHCNFSDNKTRGPDGLTEIRAHCTRMSANYPALLAACGDDNHLRLTGSNEAPDPTIFTMGEGNRGASVRIPHQVLAAGNGYLEFRAPGANVDPYVLLNALMCSVYDDRVG
jgi:glutamine synthetase